MEVPIPKLLSVTDSTLQALIDKVETDLNRMFDAGGLYEPEGRRLAARFTVELVLRDLGIGLAEPQEGE